MTENENGTALGERRLTSLHAIGQSLAIGPIFAAGVVTGLVAGAAGFNAPLSVLIGAVGALCLAYVMSLFARRFSGAGAMYEYLVHGGHPLVGAAGAALYVTGVLSLMVIWISIGFLAESFFAAHLALHVAWWIWGGAALVIATGLNHLGVRFAVEGVLGLAILSVIPFVILAIAIIVQGGHAGNTMSAFGTSAGSLNSVFKGILFAVTLFIGFEASAALGEECANPRRSIPIALLGSVAVAAVFYLLITYAAAIGFGVHGAAHAWPADPAPMGTLAQRYVGNWLATIIDLVVLTDALSMSIAFIVAVTRVIFALSRDGLLPSALASTSRRETPLGANLALLAVGTIALLYGGLTHYGSAIGVPDNIEAFAVASTTGSLLIETVYGLLCLVAIRLIWRIGGRARWWRLPIALVGLATPILAYKGSVDPWPTYPSDRGIFFLFVWFGLILVWLGYLQLRRPDRLANAAGRGAGAPPPGPVIPAPAAVGDTTAPVGDAPAV